MGRFRKITWLALLLLATVGCQSAETVKDSYSSMKRAVGLEASGPVSEVICFWQRRLSTLPDPVHEGQQTAGLVGQVFMISPKSDHADAQGDLGIVIYDTTERANGSKERTPEMFHYNQETLKRMKTKDERLGPCYAIFLPWPPEWTDVKAVKIIARYQAPGGDPLQSKEVAMNIDYGPASASTWQEKNFTKVGGAMQPNRGPAPSDMRGVPNPLKLLEQVKNGQSTPVVAQKQPEMPQPQNINQSNVPVFDGNARPNPELQRATFPNSALQPATSPSNVTGSMANSPFATEGAYAAPAPNRIPNLGPQNPNGPVQPIVIQRGP
jgi:hypothetical protein